MVMIWDKFRGEIKRPGCSATLEMMDLPNPFWMAHFNYMTAEDSHQTSQGFEEGKLEQAYNWCINQISEHEKRIAGTNPSGAVA
jgi:hypothetical protein